MPDAGAQASSSDESLVRQVLAGSEEAFACLVERHKEQALRIAYSLLNNYEDAKEVSQDAFVHAYRALGSFRQDARFRTWFYRILVNACRDRRRSLASWRAWVPWRLESPRSGSSDPDADTIFAEPQAQGPTPRDAAADRELGRRLTQALDALPPRQRAAFNLRYLHGLTLEEVAETMGTSLGAVKAQVFHAGRKLRVQLNGFMER